MTVAAATPRVQYTGNGATTAFAFAQKFFNLTDITVYREVISTGVTTLVDSSEYTVTGSALSTGGYSGGTVTFGVAPTTDHRITLVRVTPKSQDTDYVSNAGFPADGHENAADKLVMALQEMVYDISRCIKQNVSANGDLTFPTLIAGFLYSNGSSLEFKSLGDITTVPTYGASFLYGNDADKAAAPTKGDLYLATDTKKFYRCYVNGTWSLDVTFSIVTINGGIFPVQGAAPSTAAGQLAWYTKTVAGQPEWFYRKASDGAEIQVTSNGVINTALLPSTAVGSVVQVTHYQTGEVATGITNVNYDDTIPQNIEGDQFMSHSHTPQSATNKLLIEVVFVGVLGGADANGVVALFKDSDADALAAIAFDATTIDAAKGVYSFKHYMTAGTTSPITFKVRAGNDTADTVTFNGDTGARKLGGVMASSITVTEIKA